MRFRLWMLMVTVAVSAGSMAELEQRRERLARLSMAHYDRAQACFDRSGRICGFGETPQSIEAFYRRQGPTVWRDYQTGLNHLALCRQYDDAANRRWVPMLAGTPTCYRSADVRSVAEWGLEALLETIPFWGVVAVIVIVRAGANRNVQAGVAAR
jgi:hypothetical protein